jgi:lipid A disaccharide synthetase
MLEIAARLQELHPQATFAACAADAEKLQTMQTLAAGGPPIDYDTSRLYQTVKCDFAIVASGSATLQVAAAGCPMAILYQSSKWSGTWSDAG